MPFKCDQCERDFNTEQGLAQHKQDKHGLTSHAKREIKKEASEQKKNESSKQAKSGRTLKIALVIVGIIIIVGIAFAVANFLPQQPASSGSNNVLGAANATVTMVEYSDFECPFCERFENQTFPQIKAEYIDTGKMKMIYRHNPLIEAHPYAEKAAEASECAADQGKFWEYHDLLFANQDSLYLSALKDYASQLNLNTTQFNSCIDSGSMESRVQADMNKIGIKSAPLFFINGVKIEGAQPYATFKNTIENELKKK